MWLGFVVSKVKIFFTNKKQKRIISERITIKMTNLFSWGYKYKLVHWDYAMARRNVRFTSNFLHNGPWHQHIDFSS